MSDNDVEDYINDDEEELNKEINGKEEGDDTYGEDYVTATEIEEEEPAAKRHKK